MGYDVKCQYCAEEIKPDATLCKHCGKKQKYGQSPLSFLGGEIFKGLIAFGALYGIFYAGTKDSDTSFWLAFIISAILESWAIIKYLMSDPFKDWLINYRENG